MLGKVSVPTKVLAKPLELRKMFLLRLVAHSSFIDSVKKSSHLCWQNDLFLLKIEEGVYNSKNLKRSRRVPEKFEKGKFFTFANRKLLV